MVDGEVIETDVIVLGRERDVLSTQRGIAPAENADDVARGEAHWRARDVESSAQRGAGGTRCERRGVRSVKCECM